MIRLFSALVVALVAFSGQAGAQKTPAQIIGEFSCLASFCIPTTASQDIVNLVAGRTAISIADKGAVSGQDSTTAIQNTINAANQTGAAVYCPDGTYILSASLTQAGNMFGNPGGGCVLQWKTDLGAGVAGVQFFGTVFRDINLLGPGCTAFGACSKTLGFAPAAMDGVMDYTNPALASQPFFEHVHAEGFHAGVAINTNFGHWRVANSVLTNNEFGIYVYTGAGDAKVFYSEIVGQTMAGIGCAGQGHCLDGNTIILGSHLGFSPFGIYQEPAASSGFNGCCGFLDGLIEETHFESIGNGGIVSKATYNGQGGLGTLKLVHPGWIWDCASIGGNGGTSGCAPGGGGGTYTLTAKVITTGNPSLTNCNISGLATTVGIVPGMKVIDATHGGSITSNSTWVYAVPPTTPAGTVSVTTCPVSNQTGDSLTFEWDSGFPIDTPAISGHLTVEEGDQPMTPGTLGLIHASNGVGQSTWQYENSAFGPPGTFGSGLTWSGGSLVSVDNINTQWPLQNSSNVLVLNGQYFSGAGVSGYSPNQSATITVANTATTGTLSIPWTQWKLSGNDGFGSFTIFPGSVIQQSGTPVQTAEVAPTSISGTGMTFTITLPAACTAAGGCKYTFGIPVP